MRGLNPRPQGDGMPNSSSQSAAGGSKKTGLPTSGRNNAPSAPSSRYPPSTPFPSQVQALGDGIPGFSTSFDTSAKGGGAFKPISENFSVNPANGTMSFALPVHASPSRGGYHPELTLSYDSGAGNGAFGIGWNVSLPSISRKTALGIPRYLDDEDDIIMSGADIVRVLTNNGSPETRTVSEPKGDYEVVMYRPRIDNGSLRVERWTSKADPTDVYWRTLSSDNETTIYGDSDGSRILKTSNGKSRTFSWMLSKSYDAHGNAIEYTYKQEDAKDLVDASGVLPVWEKNRTKESRCRQKYIKTIKYGNRIPSRDPKSWEVSQLTKDMDWMFELIFDYGEHSHETPTSAESLDWKMRLDPFSQSHSGFEVRTYRLCRRILMFHHFPQQTSDSENLVHSIAIQYDESAHRTVLTGLSMTGHSIVKEGPHGAARCWSESLPPWSFHYSAVEEPNKLAALEVNVINLLELPGSDSKVSEWLDLDGEGMPGLLTRTDDGTLSYQRNKGLGALCDDLQFGAPVILSQQPGIAGGVFQDLDRNGHVDYVLRDSQGVLQGYFERDADTWSSFSTFPEAPNGDTWLDTLELDLTGDGLADTLCIADDSQGIAWQQNLGKKGYSGYKRALEVTPVSRPLLTKTTEVQTYVADMMGSGLSDLVEISSGSIRYWPNLGYGSFGAVVEMGNCPLLSEDSNFDHARVRLIDVDGSGTTDLLYILATGGANLYYNLAGNRWSDKISISRLPAGLSPGSVFTLDILGKGTACLCWADVSTGRNRIKYLDLMGDLKPHLLQSYSNGMGAKTRITYAPSTKFYVQDRNNGLPWSTKLPNPVQCVSKVEVADCITGSLHSTEYIYHNGCYDSFENQFAGFEMVEELNHERLTIGNNQSYELPVKHTKSWFSVGLSLTVDDSHFLTSRKVSCRLQDSGIEPAERLQALKGVNLRSEMYCQDGTDKAGLPFLIEERSYDVKVLQSRGSNRYSVVQVNPLETLATQFEREMEDPRVTHEIVLKTNLFSDVEQLLQIVYPRKETTTFSDVNENQQAGNMSLTQTWYTNEVVEHDFFRKPLPWRRQEHEVLKFPFSNGSLVTFEEASVFDFDTLPTEKSQVTWKALRTENRCYFKDSLLNSRLGDAELQAFSLLDQSYSLAFTPQIIAKIELGLSNCKIPGSVTDLMIEGRYVKLENSDSWWQPSSRTAFTQPGGFKAGHEVMEARRTFYNPLFFIDAHDNVSHVRFDEDFLLAEEVQDAVGNVTSFKNDYQRLQPFEIVDPNLNTVRALLDPLGQLVGTAALGKSSGDEDQVDSLDDMVLEISPEEANDILLDPTGEIATRILGHAGSRTVLCINGYAQWEARHNAESPLVAKTTSSVEASETIMPSFSIHMSRPLHSGRSTKSNIHVSVSYLNGLGHQFQEVQLNDPDDLARMWLTSSTYISNKDGQSVCDFQPSFQSSSAPTPTDRMTPYSTLTLCDVSGRVVATLLPDQTWSKTVYSAWTTTEHTVGDVILEAEPRDDPDIGYLFHQVPTNRYTQSWYDQRIQGTLQEKRAAEKSSIFAGAPTVTHIGCCGLPIRTARIANGKSYVRGFAYDVNGNKILDMDSYDRIVEKMLYDKLGRKLKTIGMDKGESWSLQDAQDGELLTWNCRGYSFMTHYDGKRREVKRLARKGTETPKLITRITYGEECPHAISNNLKDQVWRAEDQSGIHSNTCFNIRSHCVEKTFQACREYKNEIDWNREVALEETSYVHKYIYDNLGQALEETDAQGNRTRRVFTRQGKVHKTDFLSKTDSTWKPYLSSARFTADGLPENMNYGNKVSTVFVYDARNRSLISERTTRPSRIGRQVLQDLTHVYDCAGRRVHTRDRSKQDFYFRGTRVEPEWDYTYDVTGRLASATGRGQLATNVVNGNQLSPYNAMTGLNSSRGITDGNLLYQYLETYHYDLEGNMLQMRHDAPHAIGINGWSRSFLYEEKSLLSDDPSVKSNRLSTTSIGNKPEGRYGYAGDAGLAGCMTSIPKFSELHWNMEDMLGYSSTQNIHSGVAERTYYVYDRSGNRVRKVTESAAQIGEGPRKLKDTLFLETIELQTQTDGPDKWIANIIGSEVIAMTETSNRWLQALVRFQTGTNMELDDEGLIISYEEYSPFGNTLYSFMYGQVEAPRKYRFARYEHDRETGLYHCGARYYCPWLARWTSPDPLGDVDGQNLYEYTGSDPVNFDDHSGTSKIPTDEQGQREEERKEGESSDSATQIDDLHLGHNRASIDYAVTFQAAAYLSKAEQSSQSWELINEAFKKHCSPEETVQNRQRLTREVKLAGEQHHVFKNSYSHIFEPLGIDSHAVTWRMERSLHNLLGKIQDKNWFGFCAEAGGFTPSSELRSALENPKSPQSLKIIEEFKKNPEYWTQKVYAQAAKNFQEAGVFPKEAKKYISYYKYGRKTHVYTSSMFTNIKRIRTFFKK